ncbi:MAG: hypothetical protein KBI44_01315 [Thermoanaerobaculia bacterium]|nr:hypothetical protein [Thermoanaerobaculia bacterium]
MRPIAPSAVLCLTLAIAGALAPAPARSEAVNTRLGGPGSPTTDATDDSRLTPDGEWAIVLWDLQTDGLYELYAIRRDGSEGHSLSAAAPAAEVVSFLISADSRYVVYEAELLSNGVRELRSVPIAGPAVTARLSPDWTDGDGVVDYAISPDSSRVVTYGDFEVPGINELSSAPIAGPTGSSIHLSPAPVANGEVVEFQISPDSTRVVFAGDLTQVDRLEYWTVPIAGPSASAVRLTTSIAAGTTTSSSIHISSDSARVVYTGTFSTASQTELWSVPIAGPASSSRKLNPSVVAGGDVHTNHLEITSDGAYVVFFGDLRVDERREIWSVPIDGSFGDAVRLNPTPVAGGTLHNADPFVISPDSTWLVMHGDLETDGASELWRVPIAGPAASAVKVHPDPVAGGDVGIGDYEISPDSEFVVFLGDLVTDDKIELWSAARDAAPETAENLSAGLITPDDVLDFQIAPDSSRAVFRGDLVFADKHWLFSHALDGSGSRQFLTDELFSNPDADVDDWTITADSRDVLYEANPDDPDRNELFRRRIADGEDFQHLSDGDPAWSDAQLLGSSPEGRGALFLSDTQFDSAFLLWIADDWILSANFEEGNFTEWSSSVP